MAPNLLTLPLEIQTNIVEAYVEDVKLVLQFRVDKYNHCAQRHERHLKTYRRFICLEKPKTDDPDLRTDDFSFSLSSGLASACSSLRQLF